MSAEAARIVSAEWEMDPETGDYRLNKWGKPELKVEFYKTESKKTKPKWFTESYKERSRGNGGGYSAYARLIEAATGIKCGDPKQQEIKAKDLIGSVVQLVEAPGNKINPQSKKPYWNIVDILPPDAVPAPGQKEIKGDARFPVGPLAGAHGKKEESEDPWATGMPNESDAPLEDEIPF